MEPLQFWLYVTGDTDLSMYLQKELTRLRPSLQVDLVFNGYNYYMPVQSKSIP